jgi:hypothetical protein
MRRYLPSLVVGRETGPLDSSFEPKPDAMYLLAMMVDHGMAANTKTPPSSHMRQKTRWERVRGLALGSFLFVIRLALEDAGRDRHNGETEETEAVT